MATYKEWNENLYRYFFNDISIQDTIFFCVDSEVIHHIGKDILKIQKNIEDDFCKCVLSQILEKSNGIYRLSNKIIINRGIDSPPFETAIIAFFVYVASKMGENPIYRASNFWSLFDEIIEKYYEPYDNVKQTSYYDFLFLLFDNFKNTINKLHNIEFDFPSLFERKDRRDFVGMPIFQSMLSVKDRCILTQRFYECKNKYSKIDPDKVIFGDDYSTVFKKIRSNCDYKKYLLSRIDTIAQGWDGCVDKYDSIRHMRTPSMIPLIYQYKIDSNGTLTFYVTTKNAEKFDINFGDYKLNSDNLQAKFPTEKVTLQEVSYSISNTSLKIGRPSAKYILFKYNPETNLYTEVVGNSKIFVGDTFSIIASIDFLEIKKDSLENVISSYDEQNSGYINEDTDLGLLHGAVAGNNDDHFVYTTKKDKITILKGLTSGYKTPNSYIKGAEPIIRVENIKFVTIDEKIYYTEPTTKKNEEIYSKEFDIRKVHNNYGNHSIRIENIQKPKTYEIIDIKNMPLNGDNTEYIYNVISDDIRKFKSASEDSRSVIGAYLNNIEDIEDIVDEKVYKNNKILYILKILEQHNNAKQFPMPPHLKNMVSELISNSSEFDTYIDNNLYIDNYIYKYLSKLKEV